MYACKTQIVRHLIVLKFIYGIIVESHYKMEQRW